MVRQSLVAAGCTCVYAISPHCFKTMQEKKKKEKKRGRMEEWQAEFCLIVLIRKIDFLFIFWAIHKGGNWLDFAMCPVFGLSDPSQDLNMCQIDFVAFLVLLDLRVSPGYFSPGRSQCSLCLPPAAPQRRAAEAARLLCQPGASGCWGHSLEIRFFL